MSFSSTTSKFWPDFDLKNQKFAKNVVVFDQKTDYLIKNWTLIFDFFVQFNLFSTCNLGQVRLQVQVWKTKIPGWGYRLRFEFFRRLAPTWGWNRFAQVAGRESECSHVISSDFDWFSGQKRSKILIFLIFINLDVSTRSWLKSNLYG